MGLAVNLVRSDIVNQKYSRRTFLKSAAVAGGSLAVLYSNPALALKSLQPAIGVDNPFIYYPDRNWENCIGIFIHLTVPTLLYALPTAPTIVT